MIPENLVLEDEKVLLRPLQLQDFEHLLPYTISAPDTWKYSLVEVAGEKGMKDYIDAALAARNTGDSFPFIVYDKATGKYAGSTRFYDIQPFHQTLQLGYTWYGPEYRGTGLNKHCKYLLLSYAFEVLNMQRVEFRAAAENDRSVNAMKSIGCTVEGILRENLSLPNGGRRNSIILSILKNEWENRVKNALKNKL